jgi:hypothetical protein
MTPPENLTMKNYEVSVLRTALCWATVHISAESEAEARASAIDKAEDFKEKSCEYSVEDVRLALKHYCVIHRDNGALLSEAPEVFLCQAYESHHAEEQTVNAYPNSDILWISENPDHEKALSEYYASNDHCLNPDGEHPTHTRFDWRQAVAEQSTVSGYWVWVHHVLNNQP